MGKLKIETKLLLLNNTLSVFILCFLSIFLRWGATASFFGSVYLFFESNLYENAINRLGNIMFYSVFAVAVLIFLLIVLFFCSALKAGETKYLFCYAMGKPANFFTIAAFFTPRSAFKSVCFFLKDFFSKALWLIYYSSPTLFCSGLVFYLYSFSDIPEASLYILIAGCVVLFIIGLFTFKITVLRYSLSSFFYIFENAAYKKAAQKSSAITNGALLPALKLRTSFFGWFLSGFFIIPLFYVIPYYRLCKTLFAVKTAELCQHI